MFSRRLPAWLLVISLVFGLSACIESEDDSELSDLLVLAFLDVIDLEFPAATTEAIISIESYYDYSVEGIKSNGVDRLNVDDAVTWSLSEGAISTIDQKGRLTSGATEEFVTITASIGHLSVSTQVFISAAEFDQVVQLNSTAVEAGMCEQTQIVPIGRYVRLDASEEIRRVDNSDINNIEWLIRNKEDDAPSQRARVRTTDDVTMLRGYSVGDVLIQARAESVHAGMTVTSVDFEQAIANNVNSIKLCPSTASDLASCNLTAQDVPFQGTIAVKAVANIQGAGGATDQNISEFSKWGNDNTVNVGVSLSSDQQQVNIEGKVLNTSANLSVACGEIQQTVTDSQIDNGVVLAEAVSCDGANPDCLSTTLPLTVLEDTVLSISVEVNGFAISDDREFLLPNEVSTLQLTVFANRSVTGAGDITEDAAVTYLNKTPGVIEEIPGAPGRYVVGRGGLTVIDIAFETFEFTSRVSIPGDAED